MRKSLWIIPVLFAVIVIPYAHADSITDAVTIINLGLTPEPMTSNLDDPTYVFVCCNTVPPSSKVTDLDMTFAAAYTSSLIVSGAGATGCTSGFAFNNTVLIDICTSIDPG